MKTITAIPAYGRDYKSKAAVLKDWEEGKDFMMQSMFGCGYFNKNSDISEFTAIQFRYRKLQSTFILTLEKANG